MLSTEAAGLVIKICKGLIKLTTRIDRVLAEKEAVEGPMALPVPDVALPLTQPQMRKALRILLNDTKDEVPDPLGTDRNEIFDTVEHHPERRDKLFEHMQNYLPEQSLGQILKLNSTFVEALRNTRPDWATDTELRITAFYVSGGADVRNKSYTWRIALTVVDALAEFGSENMALFTRDEQLQSIVSAILKRFGDADLQKLDSTHDLLSTALKATLNGALDARSRYRNGSSWMEGLLDALVNAREAVPVGDQDDFLVGLLHGQGYPMLVSSVLDIGAEQLGEELAEDFKGVAADFLKVVAGIIKTKPSFEEFLEDHWGDILRAGLASLERRGPAILRTESALFGKTLITIVDNLAKRPNSKLLSTDALVGIVDVALSTVAENPGLVDEAIDSQWFETFISSITTTMAKKGVRESFTKRGLEAMVTDTLATFSNHPDLIIKNPGLARDLLQGVLNALNSTKIIAVEELAFATISGALAVIAEHPELLDYKYPQLLASFAEKVATLVNGKQLTKIQSTDILIGVSKSFAENPVLFLEVEKRLAEWVIDAVVSVSQDERSCLLVGATLVKVVHEVMDAQAVTGSAAMKNHPRADFKTQLIGVLKAGLVRAEAEIGNRMSLGGLPLVLGELVMMWDRGEIAIIDPENDNFRRLFSELADRVAA